MLLWLLHHWPNLWPDALTSLALAKITPRAALAAALSFLAALLLGPSWIRWLQKRFREPIKSDSPEIAEMHRHKQATPTMGGLFVMVAVLAATTILVDPQNPYLAPALVLAIGMAIVGGIDDLVKILGTTNGITAKQKVLGQLLVTGLAVGLLYRQQASIPDGLLLDLPWFGKCSLGLWFLPIATVVIVGASNAVNITDGLDGLAGGCLIVATAAMALLLYVAGHAEWALYLGVPRVPHAGEMAICAAAVVGAMLGFLWFNCHPAQVFLGDTGALPLGALLGFFAVVARQEWLLLIIAGVFVVEAASVILQVGYYKWRRRRIFLCAPLHHHFQLLGWPENKIVVRFWIAAMLCALIGVATLRLPARTPAPQPLPNLGQAEDVVPSIQNTSSPGQQT